MGHADQLLTMSAKEFVAWDLKQKIRHEFVRGEVFAMAGAEERHIIAAMNIGMALRNHLRGTPCNTLMNEMKVRVEAADCYFYPDVVVTCSASDNDALVKSEPMLVVEVLSPGTAAYDRGDKFADYRLLPSLQEYLLVDTAKRRCDLFRKLNDGLWVLHPFDHHQAVVLASVDLTLAPDALWERLPPAGSTQTLP